MKLDWLKLPVYRNLKGFEIDFDETQPTTVLLGRNGTGKSNLLEAIVEIFRDLERGDASAFSYSMQYICRDQRILVDCDPTRAVPFKIDVNGKKVTYPDFQRKKDAYLPTYVFAYYSGWSSRLERLFNSTTRQHYGAVLKSTNEQLPLRRMFFCRREYSQLVLLAFFLSKDGRAKQFLKDYLHIADFDSALFVLKRPWWGKTGRSDSIADARYWGARGAFTQFLDELWRHALAPVRRPEAVERDVRRQPERTERLYLFVKDSETLASLSGIERNSTRLFGYLESLFLCDLVDEVRVTARRTNGDRVKFTQLSEGEQQLLTVLGLLLFTQHDEALYLLDEPDTHLNPVWTYDYLRLLQENIQAEKGQLVVATHNPLMIGSLHKNQVRVLIEESESVSAKEPDSDPIGVGIEGLLKSELYGLRSTLAPEVIDKIDLHYQLLGKESRSEHEELALIDLGRQLNDLGIARTHPNPYFEQFAIAMAKRGPRVGTPQSREDIDAQARLADDILDELLAEEQALVGRGSTA